MGEEIIEIEPHWAEHLKHRGIVTMFIRITKEEYETTLVPENAHHWGRKNVVYNDDGEVESYDQKTLNEFAFHHSDIPETDDVVVMCCAFPEAIIRQRAFTEEDADQWLAYAGAVFGKTEADFFGVDKRRELVGVMR